MEIAFCVVCVAYMRPVSKGIISFCVAKRSHNDSGSALRQNYPVNSASCMRFAGARRQFFLFFAKLHPVADELPPRVVVVVRRLPVAVVEPGSFLLPFLFPLLVDSGGGISLFCSGSTSRCGQGWWQRQWLRYSCGVKFQFASLAFLSPLLLLLLLWCI